MALLEVLLKHREFVISQIDYKEVLGIRWWLEQEVKGCHHLLEQLVIHIRTFETLHEDAHIRTKLLRDLMEGLCHLCVQIPDIDELEVELGAEVDLRLPLQE